MSACKISDAGKAHSKVRRPSNVSSFMPHDVERNCGRSASSDSDGPLSAQALQNLIMAPRGKCAHRLVAVKRHHDHATSIATLANPKRLG